MNNSIDISVIIPMYNVDKYLQKCLTSVVNQTFKNIEIIIINDGSTDNSLNIAKDFEEKYSNVKVINQPNQGVSVARNVGLKNSIGQYILFVDSDDYIMPEMVETMLAKAKKYNLDCVVCDYLYLINNKFIASKDRLLNPNEILSGYSALREHMLINDKGFLCNKLYKKEEYYKSQRAIDTSKMVTNEDALFNFYFFINAQRVGTVTEKLYVYRHNPQSATSVVTPKHIQDLLFCLKKFDEIMKEPELKNEYQSFRLGRLFVILQSYYIVENSFKDFDSNLNIYSNLIKEIHNYTFWNTVKNQYMGVKLKIKFILFKMNLFKISWETIKKMWLFYQYR